MSKSKRYPGPKPFSADQAHLFYGRKSEAHRLRRLIEDKQLTVLYGRSGYGKSSLLNAAVLPKMEEQGYHLINVRLGAWTPQSTNTPLRSTVQAIAENPTNLDKTILDDLVQWDNSLWYYTKTFSINTKRPKLLFVFDQFEELFTYPKKEIELYENSLAELLKTSLPQRYRDQLKQKKELEGHANEIRSSKDWISKLSLLYVPTVSIYWSACLQLCPIFCRIRWNWMRSNGKAPAVLS